jgi:hypothetical protein
MTWKAPLTTAILSVTLLGFSSAADAKRLQPPASSLTTQETVCQLLGQTAYDSARARDAGVPYLRAVEIIRNTGQNRGQRLEPLTVLLMDASLKNLRLIYTSPSLDPMTIRTNTKLVCVDLMEKARATETHR